MMGLAGNSLLFRKVAIIGVGLVGGSLGKALKKQGLAKEIVGSSRRKEALAHAVKDMAIDHGTHDVKKAVINADLVVLATPVSVVPAMLSAIAPNLKKSCIITDVGSTKVSIVAAAHQALQNPSMFVGSHPLAGSEKKGVEFSTETLFQDSTCIMTPLDETNRSAVDRVKKMWTAVGSQVKILTPEEHDKALAYVSHLPHVLAYALMGVINPEILQYGAGGLRDTARIASSTPQVWADICSANAKNIIGAIDDLAGVLSTIRKAISETDEKTLLECFRVGKERRDQLK